MTLGQNSDGRELRRPLVYLGLFMILGLIVLTVQLYRLQVIRHEEFKAKSQANYVDQVRIRAPRGMIKDARGEILVDNRPSNDIVIQPAFCQKCLDEVVPRLATYLKWDLVQIQAVEAKLKAVKRSDRFRPVAVKTDISADERDIIEARLADASDLPGVKVAPGQQRDYHLVRKEDGTVLTGLAHVLGYMNELQPAEYERLNSRGDNYQLGDYIGRTGIEKALQNELRGVDGVSYQVVDARGRQMPGFLAPVNDERAPVPGHNLRLSIDQRLQVEAERAFPGTAGAVVALDVRTGFILAMVSRPAYDPNMMTGRVSWKDMQTLKEDKLEPMIFRPVSQHYAPGSTFKVVTALAALKSGQFKPSSTTFCTGGYRLGRRVWRCHLDRGHGIKDARGAMQSSCDTWFFRVADVIGLDPISEMGKSLGLGSPTGIGVVPEVPGIMPSVAYHNKVTPGGYQKGMALNSAIGQGDDAVTPLQLAMVYSAVANGGDVYQPQLVRYVDEIDPVDDRVERTIKEFQPRLLRHIDIDPEDRKAVVDGLIAVVHEPGGTAVRAFRESGMKNVLVAGKTGTAQVKRLGAVRLKTHQMEYWDRDHAWFAAFAPAEKPEIAIVVLNEHGGHGGSDAAPTAMSIFRKYFELQKAPEPSATVANTGRPDVTNRKVAANALTVPAPTPELSGLSDAGVTAMGLPMPVEDDPEGSAEESPGPDAPEAVPPPPPPAPRTPDMFPPTNAPVVPSNGAVPPAVTVPPATAPAPGGVTPSATNGAP
ncbi:MAG: penicillin-binding protein 2 [Myxococcaceae bacterium]